ncbi:MAG: protein translocase subunit SecF, partial [Calditrichaeota bacterium]
MEFFKKAHVKFIEIRRAGFIFSGSLILIGVISLILHGGPRYGIDFTGGTSLQLKFSQTMTPAD